MRSARRWLLVSRLASSSSFQQKMKQISAVEAIPGMAIGATTLRRVLISPAPSSEAASNSAGGMSARKDRIIQTAIGRFIAVYRMIRNQMWFSSPSVRAMMNSGDQGGGGRQELGGQEEEHHVGPLLDRFDRQRVGRRDGQRPAPGSWRPPRR